MSLIYRVAINLKKNLGIYLKSKSDLKQQREEVSNYPII